MRGPSHVPDIGLVRPNAHYALDVLNYSRNIEFFMYLDSNPMASLEEATEFIADLDRQNIAGERDYFLIVDKTKDVAIGTIGFIFPYPRRHGVADLGYGLSVDYWGTGAFQAACRLVLDYGFSQLGLSRIQVTTRADNVRAAAGIEKVGFRREAILRSFYRTDTGRENGLLLYLLRDESTKI